MLNVTPHILHFTCYVIRLACYMVRGISYTLRLTWVRWYELLGTCHVPCRYVPCGLSDLQQTSYVLLSTCDMVTSFAVRSTSFVDIPIRLPPARFVSMSVFVSEKVLLFGIENKK